ncbi:hypothetical protein [Sulfurivermis fontis]|uniref:hypothetical protein n=1 Tax=Sulfurivermis fontis TaxID=1972068 RepID=UPI000FDB9259|nr:hypothetical protein [Sulfurivermis fontis]
MSLSAQLSALATRIGQEIKGLVRPEHPGIARAWVNFGYVNGAIVVRAAYNVASVRRLAKGRYRIVFETPFPDADYCWVATGRSNIATGTIRFAAARSTTDGKTADALVLVCTSAAASLADTTEINLVVYR